MVKSVSPRAVAEERAFSEGTQTRALHTPRGRTTAPPRSQGAESDSSISAWACWLTRGALFQVARECARSGAAPPTSGCLGFVGCLSRFPLPQGRAGPSPRHEAWWSEITLMGIDLTAFYTCSEEDACGDTMTRSRAER